MASDNGDQYGDEGGKQDQRMFEKEETSVMVWPIMTHKSKSNRRYNLSQL